MTQTTHCFLDHFQGLPNSGNQLIFLEIVFFPSKRMECYLFNNWISSYLGFYTMYQFLLSYNLLALALELFVFFSCLECSSSWTQCSFYSIKVLLSIQKKKKNLFNNWFYIFWDFKKKKNGFVLVVVPWFHSCGSCKQDQNGFSLNIFLLSFSLSDIDGSKWR